MHITEEMVVELITIRDFIRWSITQFNKAKVYFGHGTDNAWDEAVLLISHALSLPPDIDKEVLDARVTRDEKFKIIELVDRRIYERIPAAYLLHEAWFAGSKFFVDQRVIIPRSSLGEIIENQFVPWVNPEKITRILDIGTGSGCIAIACAKAFPDAMIDAVDISNDALAVAKINIVEHDVVDKVRLIKSDVFASLNNEMYNIIIANPPYVGLEEMKTLPAEYRHEPELALAAGKDGLDIVTKILQGAAKHLAQDGILIVEVGNSETAVKERFPKLPFTWLDFVKGEGGVFLLTEKQLNYAQHK